MFRATLQSTWVDRLGQNESSVKTLDSHDVDSLAEKCVAYRDEVLRLESSDCRQLRVYLVDMVRISRVDPEELSVVTSALA